jgi:serine/threonine-protein phosphatase 2A regulatory subunit A
LEKFLPLVGGPEHAQALIPIFEKLSEIEEVTIRNACMESIIKILKQLGPNHKHQIQVYFEFFKRISNDESGELFYSRVSSCQLITEFYRLLTEPDRLVLREIYSRLCKDDLPIVKRAAASIFINFAKIVDVEILGGEFLVLYKSLTSDETQSIQCIAIEFLSTYSTMLKKINSTIILSSEILPMVKTFFEDSSWRIRLALSKQYSNFALCFNSHETSYEIFQYLMHLIQDSEPEVRLTAMAEVLPFLGPVKAQQFIDDFLLVAVHVAEDPISNVRKILAELLVDVATKVGEDLIKKEFYDLISKLIEDDDPLVRLRIIKKIPVISEELPSLCIKLTDNFVLLFGNANWRVRKELAYAMPYIVKHLGPDYFIQHYQEAYVLLLKDAVDQVRNSCAESLPKVCLNNKHFLWLNDKLYQMLKNMASGEYLVRLTMLTALKGFLESSEIPQNFLNEIINLLIAATSDKVPNIRLRAAQVLNYACTLPHLSSNRDHLYAVLTLLKGDGDKDVKFFASNLSSILKIT